MDDDQMPHMWIDYIGTYKLRAQTADTPEEYRRQLVKIAALACAAIESFDRTNV